MAFIGILKFNDTLGALAVWRSKGYANAPTLEIA